ncbi:MAG: methyltransferase domain-containing protein [Actinobacteria bacterium]|nr:methyltransferase domain-containing protein [Actinomycetota bacterium]
MDAAAWDQRYRETDRLWSQGPNLFVADRLSVAAPGVGLDLASGEGRNAVWLAGQGWKMTAVDFSEVAVERGRQASEDVEFVVADVLEWEAERNFDLALIAYLHLEEAALREVVERAAGWLEPYGELFMIGHDRSNLELGHGGPQSPEILWDVPTISGWLGDLRLVESVVVRRPVQTEEGVVYARDALVRARR